MGSFLDKLRETASSRQGGAPITDTTFLKKYPALFEYMTATAFGDGVQRTPCSLTLFAEDGAFKACLSERDLDLTLWGTGETFSDALQCLEDRLKGPSPDWRKKRPYKGKGKG